MFKFLAKKRDKMLITLPINHVWVGMKFKYPSTAVSYSEVRIVDSHERRDETIWDDNVGGTWTTDFLVAHINSGEYILIT